MMRVPKTDYIHFLTTRKFPELVEPMPPMAKKFCTEWMVYNDAEDEWVPPSQDILNQAEQYKRELESLSKDEIKNRYDIEHEKKNHEDDKKRFFNEEKARADFDYWSKMPEWTIEEAVVLSFGKNPTIVTWKRLEGQMSYLSPFTEKCLQLMEMVKRAKKSNLFTDNKIPLSTDSIRPYLFVQWMQKNELPFPTQLAEKVLKFYQNNKPPKSDFELSMEKIHESIQTPNQKQTPIIAEVSSDELFSQKNYIPPYIKLMLQAVSELGLSSNKRTPVKTIESWLHKNWPKALDGKSDRIITSMATLLRRPEDKKGGNASWNK